MNSGLEGNDTLGEGTILSAVSRLKYVYLAYAAKPKSERSLYRQVKRREMARIVEVGLQRIDRAWHLIQVAQRYHRHGPVQYTGIDLFEARGGDRVPLTLIEAHRRLAPTGAQVRLLPGDAGPTLATHANSLLGTDLLLINADITDTAMEEAWFFIPRMLHPRSLVLRARQTADGDLEWTPISDRELAAAGARRQAA